MGILFTHTEDEKYHVYRIRSKKLFIIYPILITIFFYGSIYVYKYTKFDMYKLYTYSESATFFYSLSKFMFVIGIILAIVALIDIAPMEYYQIKCFLNRKNTIVKGNWLFGDWEMKLKK